MRFRPLASSPCSPRTRGWSQAGIATHAKEQVLPAHAGMVRVHGLAVALETCAPRARGDGPPKWRASSCSRPCSPRTRGWSTVVF